VPCPLPRWTGPGAFVGCFPRPCCLPRTLAGSASTTSLSRPAQALHTLRPVDSLGRQKRPLSQGFDPVSYPTEPPASYRANRPLPGWDFHPQGERALRGRTRDSRVEERRGIVCTTRLPSPLIKPDVRISRIRLSDWLHGMLTTLRPIGDIGVVSTHQGRRRPPPCGRVRCFATASCGAGQGSYARGHRDVPRSPGRWCSESRD
jgi:hypothetical protein